MSEPEWKKSHKLAKWQRNIERWLVVIFIIIVPLAFLQFAEWVLQL